MRRNNTVSRILLILTLSAFALAAPVLVQERRQSCVNEVHVPRAVLGKRALSDHLRFMLDGFEGMEGPAEDEQLPNLAEEHMLAEHAPPPGPPEEPVPEEHAPQPNVAEEPVPEVHPPPPNQAGEHVPVPVLPDNPADFDRESVVFGDDAPPVSPEHGHSPSPSPPSSPLVESSTESYSDWGHWKAKRRSRVLFPVPPVVLLRHGERGPPSPPTNPAAE